MTLDTLLGALRELRVHQDLNAYCRRYGKVFCKKYSIATPVLNFMVGVVEADRKSKAEPSLNTEPIRDNY